MNFKNAFTSRRFRYGAVSTAISAVFIALILIVNVVATVLADKFPLTIDLTPNSAFKLSQESADFIGKLDKPIDIYVLTKEKDLENAGNLYFTQAKRVIDQYAQFNSNISLKYVDLIADPTFAAQYEELNLTYSDILITCGSKSRKISLYDMFNASTNQYTGQQTIKSSKAEQMMTSAIMGVTSDTLVKVSILGGHEEMEVPALTALLEQNNYEVITQNLTTDEIDPAADILFLLAPTRDPDAEILNKLDVFLENGQQYGKTLIYAANAQQPATPNLNAFLADWGVQVGEGAVLETDTSRIFNYNPYFCVVDFTSEDYVKEIPSGIKVSMPFGKPLTQLFEAKSGFETSVLLTYSNTAAIFPANAPENWQPSDADLSEVPALIRSTYTRYEGMTPLQSHVFVASAVSSFEEALLTSKSVSNADYYMAALNTITERTDTLTIAPKSLGGGELGINQLQATLIALVMVIVVPLAIIVAGLVIWLRRRHK